MTAQSPDTQLATALEVIHLAVLGRLAILQADIDVELAMSPFIPNAGPRIQDHVAAARSTISEAINGIRQRIVQST